eukprot:PhM_4_TR8761/c0_g1_i5/m.37020
MGASFVCATCRKGGWQTMRTLEIIACGCFPYFLGLEEAPSPTLDNLPTKFLVAVRTLLPDFNRLATPYRDKFRRIRFKHLYRLGPTFNVTRYELIMKKLLAYSRASLVPEVNALHVLTQMTRRVITKSNARGLRLLWLSVYHGVGVDTGYMALTLFSGFRRLGVHVVDVPRCYNCEKTNECLSRKHYGNGYTVFCKEPVDENVSRHNIPQRIAKKEFDFVVYTTFSSWRKTTRDNATYTYVPPLPFWSDVQRAGYGRNQIAVIDDGDLTEPWQDAIEVRTHSPHVTYFRREISDKCPTKKYINSKK